MREMFVIVKVRELFFFSSVFWFSKVTVLMVDWTDTDTDTDTDAQTQACGCRNTHVVCSLSIVCTAGILAAEHNKAAGPAPP